MAFRIRNSKWLLTMTALACACLFCTYIVENNNYGAGHIVEMYDHDAAQGYPFAAKRRWLKLTSLEPKTAIKKGLVKRYHYWVDPLLPPEGHPWHRWEQPGDGSYPLNIDKFVSILSQLGRGKLFRKGIRLGLEDLEKSEDFVRLSGDNRPYIIRHGKVLRPHGESPLWDTYVWNTRGYHIDWVILLESAVNLASSLADNDPRMKLISEGDFPVIFDAFDYPWCGDDLVPVFRLNAIKNKTECSHSWPSLSQTYMIPERETVLRDSPYNWDIQFDEWENEYPWDDKFKKVVWRGRMTGYRFVYSDRKLPREKLVRWGSDNEHIMDIKAVPWDFKPDSVGGGTLNISDVQMDQEDFMKYRGIIDIDGYAWSSRMAKLLCMNSVVLKVEPRWVNYWESELTPWVHYIPVKHDLSDLNTHVSYTMDDRNEEKIREIIHNANAWCRKKMTWEQHTVDFLWTLLDYAQLLKNAPGFYEKWKSDHDAYMQPYHKMASKTWPKIS